MHPERYSSGDAPIMTSLPELSKALGAPWSEVDRNVMGETRSTPGAEGAFWTRCGSGGSRWLGRR